MKPILLAMALLGTSIALPAFVAPPDVSASPIEMVQYRQAPRSPQHAAHVRRDVNGYNAYAASPSAGNLSRRAAPGWPCEYRDESSAYSAYPSWELCN